MLDHLVYVVPDLPAAVDRFTRSGYPPEPGGRHATRGTYNALLRLGNMSYLELLAIDPATSVPPPRWMGVDLVHEAQLTRWAVHAGAGVDPGAMESGSRQLASGKTLRWRLTDPGVAPAVNVVPFVIDWSESGAHPADNLPDLGLQLEEIRLVHPYPETVNRELSRLGVPQKAIRGAAPKIEAVLRGPNGKLHL